MKKHLKKHCKSGLLPFVLLALIPILYWNGIRPANIRTHCHYSSQEMVEDVRERKTGSHSEPVSFSFHEILVDYYKDIYTKCLHREGLK